MYFDYRCKEHPDISRIEFSELAIYIALDDA
jgi:hypothetical protein